MIDLYTWTTPNGRKPLILLEELEVAYRVVPVDLSRNLQKEPDYLVLNPNGRIPTLVDDAETASPRVVFESGAILIYLAEKHHRFLAEAGPERYLALQWLMFQMGSVGPMFGQLHWFEQHAPERVPLAIDRYQAESERILAVLDARLAQAPYLAGEYGIADMATWPWVQGSRTPLAAAIHANPNVSRWLDAVGQRPAVQRAMAHPIRAGA